MQCNTADELRAYAKSEGYDITQEEAEAYLDELSDVELDQAGLAPEMTVGLNSTPKNDCP